MSDPRRGRAKPSLIAAAQADNATASSSSSLPSTSRTTQPRTIINLSERPTSFSAARSLPPQEGDGDLKDFGTSMDVDSGPLSVPSSRTGSASQGSTPSLGGMPSSLGLGESSSAKKLKFKPKVPTRRVKADPDVKPDVTTLPSAQPARGSARGRGRGQGQRGRGMTHSTSVAAGVFGAPRPAGRQTPLRTLAPAPPVPKVYDATDIDTYSDIDDDPFTAGMMDIEEYSKLSESAPTILKRDRRDGEKRRSKSRSKLSRDTSDVNMDDGVKPEPMSPVKPSSSLADMFPPDERDGSRGSSRMDRDGRGERVRSFARTGGNEEVDEANRVDLSESESEEEVEGMEGDFVSSNGQPPPSDRLYLFQFPHLFPHFVSPDAIDMTQDTEDIKPDVKPSPAQLKNGAKKKSVIRPPVEGRIGTLVVTKRGRVKMILGKDIVMDVNPGVQANFLQQVVHVDKPSKSATVVGEVHKQFTVTPDIDRLLHELYINGGATPGDREEESRRLMRDVKREKANGLVKIEVD